MSDFGITCVEYGRWALTDGADVQTFDADFSTPNGVETLMMKASMMLGQSDEVRARCIEYAARLAEGAPHAGFTIDQLRAKASAAAFAAENPNAPRPVLVRLSNVQPRRVEWLWRDRIPLGRITLLAGRPGGGKSYLTMDIASRVSTGSPWPDGAACARGSVVIASAEDDAGDTIRPRIDACRGDVNRISVMQAIQYLDADGKSTEAAFSLAHMVPLEQMMLGIPDLRLLVIDPIGSYLGGKVDAHRDNEVRSVLAPLAKLAEKYNVAILVVAHHKKGIGDHADDMALGSRAFTGLARVVWHVSRDPVDKNRRLLLPGKNNLAPEGDGLSFQIAGEPPRVLYGDRVAMNADEGMAAEKSIDRTRPGPLPQKRNHVTEWLQDLLAAGPQPAAEIRRQADEAGWRWRTVQDAATTIGVRRHKEGLREGWVWSLPEDAGASPTNTNTAPSMISAPSGKPQ